MVDEGISIEQISLVIKDDDLYYIHGDNGEVDGHQ
jgi:hypothetical protein